MPDGHIQRIDEHKKQIVVVRNGRRFVAAFEDVDADARVNGARVHFAIAHIDEVDRAERVHLASGTRTNKRQRRFGDLTGAKRPGAKVKSTSTSRLGIDVTSQPIRVINAWVDSMKALLYDDATSLYAPDAILHTQTQTFLGRKQIRAALEDIVSPSLGDIDLDIRGVDQLVCLSTMSGSINGGGEAHVWVEVDAGAITEQWFNTAPAFVEEQRDGLGDELEVSIIRTGGVDASQERRLRDDIDRVAKRVHVPIDQVRIKIDAPATPSHPYSVSAAIHAGAAHVRSHVTAPTFEEAVDTVCLRLRRQLDRSFDRLRRGPDQHRPDESSWRHGDRRGVDDLQRVGPRPNDRELVRHKAWGPQASSVEEALWDMELADYDFYLFVEETTSEPALVWRSRTGVFLQLANGQLPELVESVEVETIEREALLLTPSSAIALLNESSAPFVFAVAPNGNTFVVYRRLDGHYGLIETWPSVDEDS